MPQEEVVSGVPHVQMPISLRQGLGVSSASLVVGIRGIVWPETGRYQFICTATNLNETTTIQVNIDIPGFQDNQLWVLKTIMFFVISSSWRCEFIFICSVFYPRWFEYL